MNKFAIVEDNEEFATTLASYFKQLEAETGDDFELHFFDNGEDFLKTYNKSYDAVYLDIMLPGKTGMEIAEIIRQTDSDVILLFVTNMIQFAIEGYSVNAVDYILKPLTYPDFKNSTLKVLYRISKRQTSSISLTNKDGVFRLSLADIYYAEVQGHTVTFYSKNDTVSVRGTLKETEEALSGNNFCKCSNCFLINLNHVTAFNKTEVTVGPYALPVSRRSYTAFSKELTDFIGREH